MERNRRGRPRHPDVLTPAEWRVLDALREGGTNAEIAARLGLSADTVKTHISNMLAKLELRDRRALAAWRPDTPRRRPGGVVAVPAVLWSARRPLAWVGVGAAALAGVVVVVVALVALEGIVERDRDPRSTVAPPPTATRPPSDSTPTPAPEVFDCSSGIAVMSPDTNTELVADCEALLGLRDRIRGTGRLNWSAGKAMSEWTGVTVSGTPQRVTALNLADLGLDGELSGLLGNLTGLTTLDLSGNPLTGMIPSKLALLTNLTNVSLSGTSFSGCAPPVLADAATSDVTQDRCGETEHALANLVRGEAAPPGTFSMSRGRYGGDLIFDLPEDSGLIFAYAELGHMSPVGGDFGLVFENAEQTVSFAIDVQQAGEWPRKWSDSFTHEGTTTGYTRADYEAIFDRILESMWIEATDD